MSDTLAAAKEAFGAGETLSFEEIQARLVALKPELDKYQQVKKEYDILREAAQYEMLAKGVKSTLPVKGFSLVLSERNTPVVTDEDAVWSWLQDNVEEPSEYTKLDSAKVVAFAQNWFQETGEIVPGIENQSTQYVSVKKVK